MTDCWRLSTILIVLAGGMFDANPVHADERELAEEFFETKIRPLLVERCIECHGPGEQWAGLRLDTRDALLKGGESGAAIVPGKPETSQLLHRVREPDDDLRMPPAESGDRLTAPQINALQQWIAAGAVWPVSPTATDESAVDSRDHWAFQPVRSFTPPAIADPSLCQTPIDRFLLNRLESDDLSFAPPADRRTLIRRLTYDLTGLPPTATDVAAFVADDSPDAYERLVERLLASPHYGEHWGRHWLDVARYSDTKGYVYAREERFFVHAPVYREWVVDAFNDDLPYDRFVVLQLAADQAHANTPRDLAAMGYLTLGRRFIGVTPDIIDDRIDVVTRGLMGLTVTCARCHDHKYDPVPTADYYSLYGVFRSSAEELVPIPAAAGTPVATDEYQAELQSRKQKLADTLRERRGIAEERLRQRIADYLAAQREIDKYPVQGFDVVLSSNDLIPASVHRWQDYLRKAEQRRDPVFMPWFAFQRLANSEFSTRSGEITAQIAEAARSHDVNPRVARAFETPPHSLQDVAARYGDLFGEIDRQWQAELATAETERRSIPDGLSSTDDEALRQVLYGAGSPCVIPDEAIVDIEWYFDSDAVNALWKLQGEVDRWLLTSPRSSPHAVILVDRALPVEPRIFRRGNAALPGDEVPRQFLELLAGKSRHPFSRGSGRLEMAEAIVDRENPLTARVWVNRVWGHIFGAGLVATPSDFGTRAEPPSHPELLDWLASRFMQDGWSTKSLLRLIVNSTAYRQSSFRLPDDAVERRAARLDPENRLLWRMNAHRLSFEELRDTLLAVSDDLDRTMGGRSAELFPTDPRAARRTIYGQIDRQFVPGEMRIFDFANPDLHSPQRSETTVPQQSLFALNHPFVADRARSLASHATGHGGDSDATVITRLFTAALQHEPTEPQLFAAASFLEAARNEPVNGDKPAGAAEWSYGYGAVDEASGHTGSFHALPHFTGTAWQGGPAWPDPALGWAQLTATGGHAGNDRHHAVIRRWTAPRDMMIAVRSIAIHDAAAGDGIRCWIVSSAAGVLASTTLHNAELAMNVDAIAVQAGDTVDFVVDFHSNLNNDQFQWAPEITTVGDFDPAHSNESSPTVAWHAASDFAGPRPAMLDPWEQLAQVLLISNELMFAD